MKRKENFSVKWLLLHVAATKKTYKNIFLVMLLLLPAALMAQVKERQGGDTMGELKTIHSSKIFQL
jgi:hypothetical protein